MQLLIDFASTFLDLDAMVVKGPSHREALRTMKERRQSAAVDRVRAVVAQVLGEQRQR